MKLNVSKILTEYVGTSEHYAERTENEQKEAVKAGGEKLADKAGLLRKEVKEPKEEDLKTAGIKIPGATTHEEPIDNSQASSDIAKKFSTSAMAEKAGEDSKKLINRIKDLSPKQQAIIGGSIAAGTALAAGIGLSRKKKHNTETKK